MTIHFGKEKWLIVAQWVLLLGCWLLIVTLLGSSANHASRQAFLEQGPEKIVGTQNVIYQEAPDYLYTNPVAMMRLHFHCLAVRFGVTLLVAALATGLVWAYRLLYKRKVWTTTLKVAFWCAMGLALLYLGMVCVWEWGQAWNALLLYATFYPHWSNKSVFRKIKSVFTAMAMLVALVILGFQRMELQSASRRYDAQPPFAGIFPRKKRNGLTAWLISMPPSGTLEKRWRHSFLRKCLTFSFFPGLTTKATESPWHGAILRQNIVNFWQSVLYYTMNRTSTTCCKKNSCDN